MPRCVLVVCLLLASCPLVSAADDSKEELWAAARKGDAAAVKDLLGKGVDVNSKTAYGATALSFAAEKGHLEVVKVLLDRKADVNVKDTFYNATPLTWALGRKRWDIVQALVAAGSTQAEVALRSAVQARQTETVRTLLEKTKLGESALTSVLAAAPTDKPEIADLLKKAGAKPPAAKPAEKKGPPPDEVALRAFAGNYEHPAGSEVVIHLEGGKLRLKQDSRDPLTLTPLDANTFKPETGTAPLSFQRDGDKVTGFVIKSGENTVTFRRTEPRPRVEVKPPPEDAEPVKEPKNWPAFRGLNAGGVADGQHPPISWDVKSGRNVRWKTPVPGLGHSCPVVWGDRVFLTTAVGGDPKAGLRTGQYGDVDSVDDATVHRYLVLALDKQTGKVVWERQAHEGVPKVKRHLKSTHANPTVATDGRHVVACFGSEGLYGYDIDGKPLWKRDLGNLDAGWFYDSAYQWGFGSSPVIFRDLVILQCDVGKGSFLAAYRVADGTPVWRTPREEIPSWGSPTVVEAGKHAEVVTNATKFARGYDPLTGKELWRLGKHSEITVPTPVFGCGLIFVTSGYRPVQPIYAVRPGATGDISLKDDQESNAHVAWSKKRGGPYMPTPVVYGDHLYVVSNGGVLVCFEARTGKQVYSQRLGGRGGYTAAPVAADGRLYFVSEEGEVRVVRTVPKFELLATNRMDDVCMATPAISDGLLFVRTQRHLYALGRTPDVAPGARR
jgi:outer membrane protein assembly factor BamB